MDNLADANLVSYSHISKKMVFSPEIKFSKENLELDILHSVYGEDIPIAIDPMFIASRFNINIEEKELSSDIESQIYFSQKKQSITIEHIKTSEFKKAYIISQNLGHLFLHILKDKKKYFLNTISLKNNFQEHRVANNETYNLEEDDYKYKLEANNFAGQLLIPKGALLEIFKDTKKGYRFLLSDLCKVFNSPNDIMVEMLQKYNLWDFSLIYDDL